MPKSALDDRAAKGRPLLRDIWEDQIGRLKRADARDREPTLQDWADLAQAEAAVKERYRGRYLFELIQNANDAIVDQQLLGGTISAAHHLVRIELTRSSLLVANYGQPFGPNNVRALCRLHNTTKSASKQIGHKGIGFKSVLEICSRPQVYSSDYFFGFDGERFRHEVEAVMGSATGVAVPLPVLRTPYAQKLASLNPAERERIERLFEDGYATVVRLPWDEESTLDSLKARIEADVQPSLLLFMNAISQIEMLYPDGKEVCYYRRLTPTESPVMNELRLHRSSQDVEQVDSRWLVLGPIEVQLKDKQLVSSLDKAWQEVTALRFSLAFPLDIKSGQLTVSSNSQRFYVYFPTEEFCGLPFAVHGDFHVGDERKTLPLNPLNEWLIGEICFFLAGHGLDLLKRRFGYGADIVQALAPVTRPEREFSRCFLEKYLEWLRLAPFVPIDGGQYKAPDEIRFPPKEVDQARFRSLFPASRLRGTQKWAYPIPEVVSDELERKQQFILSRELGGQVLAAKDILGMLDERSMPPIEECRNFLDFVAHWWDNTPGGREAFEELLETIPIFPTTNGWQKPGSQRIFQANLRPGVQDVVTPPGFEFSVILRSAYPESGSYSATYRLFKNLGARDYAARDIIRDAILPVLTSADEFASLVAQHPGSIVAVYRLLRQYYLDERATTDLRDRLSKVPVPAVDGRADGWSGWRAAGDCYLGKDWPGGDILQSLYEGFEDCFFLAEVPQLDIDGGAERAEWAEFFGWLGVMDHPRLVESSARKTKYNSGDPFGGSLLWAEYFRSHREDFHCKNPNRNHQYSRQLDEVETLHRFGSLVAHGDSQKLMQFYQLLGRHWTSEYRSHLSTWIRCEFTSTGCPRDQIESFFMFQLRNAPWVPVQVGTNWAEPLSPRQIWVLGETDPGEVRGLVPTLPADLRSGLYQDLATDLGFISSSTAQIEDYVRLLELLPKRYLLASPDMTAEATKGWQKSVRAVFNWVCERIQTGLVSRGEGAPDLPQDLQILAYRGEQPCYVRVDSPELVYPDNSFLGERWKAHCAYLRINDDWKALRKWLRIPDLSEVVESRWQPQQELPGDAERLRQVFIDVIPYYLALIKQAQPANYDRILSRLQRLRVHVVSELTVEEKMIRMPNTAVLASNAHVHLEKREDPNPRGGPLLRGGDLYATAQVLDNPDLLGEYIADYVEIARLGDAFVLLVERNTPESKQRFLDSKGISAEMVAQVRSDWGTEEPSAPVSDQGDAFARMLIQNAIADARSVAASTTTGQLAGSGAAGRGQVKAESEPESPEEETAVRKREYPKLDLNSADGIIPASQLVKPGHAGGPGGHGAPTSGPGSIPSQEVTEELGRRGEEWAYENEKKRLLMLGFDPSELERMECLKWEAQTHPTANYDILSIRDMQRQEQVYIEVKSSTGRSPNIRMSMSEFRLALSHGDSYWLYWVGNVDQEQPDKPVCYENLARLVEEDLLDTHIDTLFITLPKVEQPPRVPADDSDI